MNLYGPGLDAEVEYRREVLRAAYGARGDRRGRINRWGSHVLDLAWKRGWRRRAELDQRLA